MYDYLKILIPMAISWRSLRCTFRVSPFIRDSKVIQMHRIFSDLVWGCVSTVTRLINLTYLSRMMYWTVVGDHSHIEEAAMDGTLRRILVQKNLQRPTGMICFPHCLKYEIAG